VAFPYKFHLIPQGSKARPGPKQVYWGLAGKATNTRHDGREEIPIHERDLAADADFTVPRAGRPENCPRAAQD